MKGFSLLEILIYISLTSFMLSGLFASAAFLHDSMLRSKREAIEMLDTLNARDAADIGTHDL